MSTPLYYTGIGRITIPENIYRIMKPLGYLYASQGWVLRSGGAKGADSAFEEGARLYAYKNDLKLGDVLEIFIAGKKTLKQEGSGYFDTKNCLQKIKNGQEQVSQLLECWHPNKERLATTRHYMEANCLQILGQDLQTPSALVICWTHDGHVNSGGTGFSKRLAAHNNIEVLDLYYPQIQRKFEQLLKAQNRT